MNKDDIIKLMQQACDPDKKPAWHNGFWTVTQEEIERFAAALNQFEPEPRREWQVLTDDEIWSDGSQMGLSEDGIRRFAREIEAKLKEKNA